MGSLLVAMVMAACYSSPCNLSHPSHYFNLFMSLALGKIMPSYILTPFIKVLVSLWKVKVN